MNPVRKTWRGTWMLLLISAVCPASPLLDSTLKIEQFSHTAWGEKEGAPQQIFAITQTKDGYLWLASATQGLVRFDGVVFERYQPATGPTLPENRAFSLLALPNGDLWVGFGNGRISLLKNGQAENYTTGDGIPDGNVHGLVCDREGTIWAAISTGLARLEGKRWKKVGEEWNFTGKSTTALFADSNGTLWVATDSAIVFLPRGSRRFQSTSARGGMVAKFAESPDGKLWMAAESVRPVPHGTQIPQSDTVEVRVVSQGMIFSREGDLWITSTGDGIRRLQFPEQSHGKAGTAAESFTTKQGLADNFDLSIFQDHEGNFWVGTLSGLERFRMSGLVPVSLPYSHPNPILAPGDSGDLWSFLGTRIVHVEKSSASKIKEPNNPAAPEEFVAAYREAGGAMWMVSMAPALVRFEHGHFSQFPAPKELPKPFTGFMAITEDRSGVLWMAVEQQGLFRREKGMWNRFDTPPEISNRVPIAAFTDDPGRPWFGFSDGTIIYLEGITIHTVSTRQNLPVKGIWAIQGRNKHVWIGGYSGGLVLFDGDQFHKVVPEDRPSFERIFGIQEFADGSLWLCEQHGIIHIAAAEIRKFLGSYSYRVHYEVLDFRDGLPGKFLGTRHSGQNLVEGADGRIWFGTDHGIAWLNPATIQLQVPPPVSIRSLLAADKQFPVESGLTLPPRSQKLEIDYTALNLSVPERVRFKYRLDGLDNDWQDAGVRRQAFYTNLGPGKYRFHISARNEGGEWNTEEAVLDFRIAPAWFQTIWFRSFCVCVFVFLLWMLYQLRLRQLQRQFSRALEARVSERTRIARDLHDTLLQTFSASLLRFQSVAKMLPARPDEAKQRVDSAIEQASSAIAEGRDAVHQLRAGASTDVDLGESISHFVEELARSAGENLPELRVQVEGSPRDLNPLVRDEAYRIAAEALRNAVRYAGARQIEVEIRYDEQQLRLRIRDDGKGIDPGVLEQGYAAGHWGLRGMRERAKLLGGNFEVWSQTGSGTEIELVVPAARAYARPASRWTIFLKSWRN